MKIVKIYSKSYWFTTTLNFLKGLKILKQPTCSQSLSFCCWDLVDFASFVNIAALNWFELQVAGDSRMDQKFDELTWILEEEQLGRFNIFQQNAG